jgi:hypothetical protein
MPSKKINSSMSISDIACSSVVGIVVLVAVLSARCNSGESKQKINWLDVHPGWDTVLIDSIDAKHFEFEKRKIRAYVRGWADEHNNDHGTHYRVTEFEFISTGVPFHYTVKAYLRPPVQLANEGDHHEADTGFGSHLIPAEPPPPK